jgi:hypothetical protein
VWKTIADLARAIADPIGVAKTKPAYASKEEGG